MYIYSLGVVFHEDMKIMVCTRRRLSTALPTTIDVATLFYRINKIGVWRMRNNAIRRLRILNTKKKRNISCYGKLLIVSLIIKFEHLADCRQFFAYFSCVSVSEAGGMGLPLPPLRGKENHLDTFEGVAKQLIDIVLRCTAASSRPLCKVTFIRFEALKWD